MPIQRVKRRFPAFLLLSLIGCLCFMHETVFASKKPDFDKSSVEELIRILEDNEYSDKWRVFGELRSRGENASRALPNVVKFGEDIMSKYHSSISTMSSYEVDNLFYVIKTIGDIGNASAPGASQAAEFLVDLFRNRENRYSSMFRGEHIDYVESSLLSLSYSSLVPVANGLKVGLTNIDSAEKVLAIIANNIVKNEDMQGLQELKKAQKILQNVMDEMRDRLQNAKYNDPSWDIILPPSIKALEGSQREKHPVPQVKVPPAPPIYKRIEFYSYVLGMMILLNLSVILLATRFRWARTIIFHPVGAHVLGLFVGKYMLTDFVMHFIRPIRLAMLRDYRIELSKRLNEMWAGRFYIHPQIALPETIQNETKNVQCDWQVCLEAVTKSKMKGLWLIQGESGIGKTALIEQWSILALQLRQTPILLRLGGGLRVEEELASNLLQYGDLSLKPEVAQSLIKAGGFLILLDAFNEDLQPTATREFVRHAIRNNHVVITSQIRPEWDKLFNIRELYLHPFGREQLSHILPVNWVDQVLSQNYLRKIVALPYTAQLLARFIKKKEELPRFRVDLYEDMFKSLEELSDRDGLKQMVPNLYEKASKLFFSNSIFFHEDDRVPTQLCSRAVEVGILTRAALESQNGPRTNYRFSHELIHRYCVALYLDRQKEIDLLTWHDQLEINQPKRYWENVIDFSGELLARRVSRNEVPIESYEQFLKDTFAFSSEIFSKKMYLQADRLQTSKLIELNPEFVTWSARTLASAHV